MLNRRIFNAIVGTIPFIGLNPKEQKNELAEYILQKISERTNLDNIENFTIGYCIYLRDNKTPEYSPCVYFSYNLKNDKRTTIWDLLEKKNFDLTEDNLKRTLKELSSRFETSLKKSYWQCQKTSIPNIIEWKKSYEKIEKF